MNTAKSRQWRRDQRRQLSHKPRLRAGRGASADAGSGLDQSCDLHQRASGRPTRRNEAAAVMVVKRNPGNDEAGVASSRLAAGHECCQAGRGRLSVAIAPAVMMVTSACCGGMVTASFENVSDRPVRHGY